MIPSMERDRTASHAQNAPPLGFLVDLDGVMYRGDEAIPGAAEFVLDLEERGIPFAFVTNDSRNPMEAIVRKLRRFGLPARETSICTSARVVAAFVRRTRPRARVLALGELGLVEALRAEGLTLVPPGGLGAPPDYVIVGEARSFDLEAGEAALRAIREGAKLLAANPDPRYPAPEGFRFGCGALTAAIESAAGVAAFSVGKPSPIMMRAAAELLGSPAPREIVVVGDSMGADILGGLQMGWRTVLVLTGNTRLEDVEAFPYAPDVVVDSIARLRERLPFARTAA